jgi:protein SCO1
MRPRLAIALALLALVAGMALLVAVFTGGSSTPSHPPATVANPVGSGGFDGAELPGNVAAPNFTLTDQDGRSVTLSRFRGRVTVLTFLYSTCGAPCVVIAQQIRGALNELAEEHAPPPAALMVSVDPTADTPARVGRFLAEVSLTGRVRYLSGPPPRLRSIWRAYDVTPASAGMKRFENYAKVLLIDGRGVERVLYETEQLTPESLTHDIGRLDGDPTHP